MTMRILFTGLSAIALAACTQVRTDEGRILRNGQMIFAKECAQCHGRDAQGDGVQARALGIAPPDLTELSLRNDGVFPREFVRRFVMGLLEKETPDAPMPEFSKVGLRHVYPDGGADGEVLETDFSDLLEYLEAIQD